MFHMNYQALVYLEKNNNKQEAHRPWLPHLSETATADMQMKILCNISPILSLQLM